MRRIILAGNWKMNQTPSQAQVLLEELKNSLPATKHTVAVFPPYLALTQAVAAGEPFLVGAQNCHFEDKGAFTGEISLPMLSEIGVKAVIVGHSERRQYFGETDEDGQQKDAGRAARGAYPGDLHRGNAAAEGVRRLCRGFEGPALRRPVGACRRSRCPMWSLPTSRCGPSARG